MDQISFTNLQQSNMTFRKQTSADGSPELKSLKPVKIETKKLMRGGISPEPDLTQNVPPKTYVVGSTRNTNLSFIRNHKKAKLKYEEMKKRLKEK